ncbi:MAG: SPFH domain-containing protein [Lentisphaerae bacterium]|nr:SPFH domain-containing protein [Lentisphaerota bacterium]
MAIIDVVTWDPAPGVFAWRFPNSELHTKTQLIVSEGQEAVLFNQGTAIGPFGPGRHVLDTANYPVLTSFVKIATGGITPFKAEVWFISKAFKLDVKWGTAGAIQVEDPQYHIILPVRAFGQYGITVEDSALFLSKMIGMVPAFVEKVLADYFKGIIITRAKDLIAKYLVDKQISVLLLSAHLNDISNTIERQVSEELAAYGVKIVNFTVNSISTDEQDPAVKKLRAAMAKKAEMDIIGYNYQQERSFDTLETAAGNSGNGGMMNAGMGLSTVVLSCVMLCVQSELITNLS